MMNLGSLAKKIRHFKTLSFLESILITIKQI